MSERPKKILVVDDEQEALDSLSNILKRSRYEIITSTQGKGALALTRQHQPDLIILDVVLPDMDGGDVAAVLSQSPQTADIPILFLTGILTKEEEETGHKSGKHYVMAKPIVAEEVLEKVSKILAD